MTSKVSINLERFIDKGLPRVISNGLEVCGQYMENKTKENITAYGAVDTGTLKRSITHKVSDKKLTVGTNVEYAAAVHQGHGKLKSRPYLQDVADYNMADIVNAFKRGATL